MRDGFTSNLEALFYHRKKWALVSRIRIPFALRKSYREGLLMKSYNGTRAIYVSKRYLKFKDSQKSCGNGNAFLLAFAGC